MVVSVKSQFDLKNQNNFFGGFPVVEEGESTYSIAITFPVEGWEESAAAVVAQDKKGILSIETYGAKKDKTKAISQALATLSLNVDDSDWQNLAKTDKVIANLQAKYNYLRPVLFHSPYEAAAGFVIGQRISIKQRQAIQKKMAEQYGAKIKVGDQEFAAFPRPQILLDIKEYPGLNPTKLERLHGIARAAIEGRLDRKYLLNMSEEEALDELQQLEGIGPFYASGILYRGAGIVDGVTDDKLTKYAIQQAYNLPKEPTQREVLKIAENWQPYRMWCEVLLHVWLRREIGLPRFK